MALRRHYATGPNRNSLDTRMAHMDRPYYILYSLRRALESRRLSTLRWICYIVSLMKKQSDGKNPPCDIRASKGSRLNCGMLLSACAQAHLGLRWEVAICIIQKRRRLLYHVVLNVVDCMSRAHAAGFDTYCWDGSRATAHEQLV
jgi:hypothetical protein